MDGKDIGNKLKIIYEVSVKTEDIFGLPSCLKRWHGLEKYKENSDILHSLDELKDYFAKYFSDERRIGGRRYSLVTEQRTFCGATIYTLREHLPFDCQVMLERASRFDPPPEPEIYVHIKIRPVLSIDDVLQRKGT